MDHDNHDEPSQAESLPSTIEDKEDTFELSIKPDWYDGNDDFWDNVQDNEC